MFSKNKWRFIALVGAVVMSICPGYGKDMKDLAQSTAQAWADASLSESFLRTAMMTNQTVALRGFFTSGAERKWIQWTNEKFSQDQIRDFFFGAIQFRGPVEGKGAVGAYYNPWWDAILITESVKSTVAAGNATDEVYKVTDFVFLSGERFREEKTTALPSLEAISAIAGLPVKTACRFVVKTMAKFDEIYAEDAPALLDDHKSMFDEGNINELVGRSAVRLKLASDFIKNKKAYREGWELCVLMRKNKTGLYNLIFPSDMGKLMTAGFKQLPERVRHGFEPYSFFQVKDKDIRVHLLVNKEFPRLFALAYLGRDCGKATFLWFDLYRAKEILEAFALVDEEVSK